VGMTGVTTIRRFSNAGWSSAMRNHSSATAQVTNNKAPPFREAALVNFHWEWFLCVTQKPGCQQGLRHQQALMPHLF
jgi:hypothetical protein